MSLDRVPVNKRGGVCVKCGHRLELHHPALSPGYYVCIGTSQPRVTIVKCSCAVREDEDAASTSDA